MNDPRNNQKNPTFGVGVLIVVVVLLVIGTLLYNAITEKHKYERENPPAVSSAAAVASAVGAIGASQ